ncbi:MAG: HEPN domain-containing protein [Candidatus Bathyarchaeota archaeon]
MEIKKIKLSEVATVITKKRTIGDIIAEQYNFQNLESIYSAYMIFEIDTFQCLDSLKQRKAASTRIVSDFPVIDNPVKALKELLKLRHKIVHKSFVADIKFEEWFKHFFTVLHFGNKIDECVKDYIRKH